MAPVVGRSGGLLRAESVLVAALVLEMEMLGPEACLRMMAVETNAAHLMALETSSATEEACGRLQSVLVKCRGWNHHHRDTHPVSHLHVACISNRLLLMLTVAAVDRRVAVVGGASC